MGEDAVVGQVVSDGSKGTHLCMSGNTLVLDAVERAVFRLDPTQGRDADLSMNHARGGAST